MRCSNIIGISLSLLLITACSDSGLPTNRFSHTDAEQIALRMVPNSTVASIVDSVYRQTTPAWYVTVTPSTKGRVIITLHQNTGELLHIFGLEPPFDYEVDPGLLLFPFTTVRDTALQIRPGILLRWELLRPVRIPRWEYQFYIRTADSLQTLTWLVSIDAETGFPIATTQLP